MLTGHRHGGACGGDGGERRDGGDGGEMKERGATKPVFREGVQLVVWPSDALTRSLTLVVDKWMECNQNILK